MPKKIVEIDQTAEIAERPQETFTDAAVVGTSEEQLPDAEFGEVGLYRSAASVADDYGEDTDVHVASQAIQEMGADRWRVMVLEAVEATDEAVADGEMLENTPVLANHEVSSPDGDIEFTTEDAPDIADYEAEIVIHSGTGEVTTDATEVEISYFHADWSQLEKFPSDVNRFAVADRRFDRQGAGVLDVTHSWATENDIGMAANGPNVDEYEDIDEAKAVAHDVAGYVQSGDLMMIVDASNEDLAAYQLGELGINNPWYNPFWNELPVGEPISKDVGEPDEPGTFEGGNDEGEGPVNALINVADANRVSNSLTTAGIESDAAFFDIRRTQDYTASVLETALESLQTDQEQIPFTDDGQVMIEDAVKGAMSGLTGSAGQPLAEYNFVVPGWEDDDVDRQNRNWGGIEIDARLAGSAHEFSLGLTVSV